MASTGPIIILVIVILVIVGLIVGIVLYLWLRNPSSGNIANGDSCTANSDCISQNCSTNVCQPSGIETGTAGAVCSTTVSCTGNLICQQGKCVVSTQQGQPNGSSCSTDEQCLTGFCSDDFCQNKNNPTGTAGSNCSAGAPCDANLICTQGSCVVPPVNSGSANGSACTLNTDCASSNCSLGFCQNKGTQTGQFAAVCNPNGTPGCGINIGLKCGPNQTCIIDQSIPILGQFCSTICQPGSICTDLDLQAQNPKYCSALGPEPLLIPGISGHCLPGFTYDPSRIGCMANQNQSCVLDEQCVNNNCASGWNGWTMGTIRGTINSTSWVANIPSLPGAVEKVVAYTVNGIDYLRILVPSGTAPGIYDYQTQTGSSWLLKASINQPQGEIINFAVSRDGVLHLIVINASGGNATVPLVPGSGDGATGVFQDIDYAAVFQVDSGTQSAFSNTRPYFDSYPDGYQTEPGMVLASYAANPIVIQPGTFSDPTQPPVTSPLTIITEIDIDQNLEVLLQGVTRFTTTPTTSMSFYYTQISNPDGSLFSTDKIPFPFPQSNSYLAQNYNFCLSGNTYQNCVDSSVGIGQDENCGLPNDTQPGFCYRQSAKQFRLVWTPDVWNCTALQSISTSTTNLNIVPSTFFYTDKDTLNSFLSSIFGLSLPAVFANNLHQIGSTNALVWGTCLAAQSSGISDPSSVLNYFLPPNLNINQYFILDFDMCCAISGLYAGQYANLVQLVAFANGPRTGQIGMLYTPTALAAPNKIPWFNLPGYFSAEGRVALGQNGIYYLGPGKCTSN